MNEKTMNEKTTGSEHNANLETIKFQIKTEQDAENVYPNLSNGFIHLTIRQSLCVIEDIISYLNYKNNEIQQHIRTNKDKDNQKIVDRLTLAVKQELDEVKKIKNATYGDSLRYLRIQTILTGKVWGEPAECFKELSDDY